MAQSVRPGPRTVAYLWSAVEHAREEVGVARQLDGIDRSRLVAAQRNLLLALETFMRALEAAGLEPHRQLRAEAELLQGVTTAPRRAH